MAIMKSEQILAESTISFEDAIQNAVSRFSRTVRGLASANVDHREERQDRDLSR